ncbi:hypothetical protein C4D60_Mb08t20950 [Musa balbisiana]|uniref:Uncharacterized protein n=1 Tax=Musa balbisiana TaxID=52838 RepID=A0A4S8K5A8_MUSBA|nr:hypothetical protein C4D60_Mb08t20950 [Musa balbisiana]
MEGISRVVPRGGRGRRPAGGFGRGERTSFTPGEGSAPVSLATLLVLVPAHRELACYRMRLPAVGRVVPLMTSDITAGVS